jgi:hypothetical protein
MSRLIRTVRANAARHGIDLSGPFVPAPGLTEFSGAYSG